jgi:gliding motility-associated-like protein
MKKVKHILLIFLCGLFVNHFFSQQETKTTFNASFWNAYADKIQLSEKDKLEFITAHKKLNSPTSSPLIQGQQIPQVAKNNNQNNILLAGPCVNADFEAGNLSGWVRSSGFHPGFNPLGCCPNVGGQQTIMAGAGVDPFGGFPIVFPGGNFSLRLGDGVNGGEADRIEQTFLVSPANVNFSYKYAVVLQDPGHLTSQQPSFQVEMLDSTDTQIPCTYFFVAAGQGIPGFFNSPTPGVIYKPWTTVLIDLTPYLGQNVTIRFTTFDCSLGGHFGYAYIDGVCQSFVGGGSANICAGATQTFCAPAGLASYTWNGPGVVNVVGQCVVASAPGVYTVQTTLFSNCNGPPFTYTLTNQPAPIANAGPNATVCANNSTLALSGSISGYSATPLWSTSGSGVFTSSTNLTTTYTPSPSDISAGSVTLTLSTQNNGVCPPSISTLQVLIIPSPSVIAGSNQTICSNSSAALTGTVIGPTNTGSWTSSGSGTFSPSPNVINATYFPSLSDIFMGSITLTLTSTGNQGCFPASATMALFFQNPPQANAGPNFSICANNSTVNLSGTISGFSATPIWSTSGNGIFTSTTNLTTTYTAGPADISAGFVNLTLSTANNGVCPPSTSSLQIIITPPPIVFAGPSQTICSLNNALISGTVTGPTSTGIWTSSGSGTFSPAPNILNTSYIPSPSDINTGSVTLFLSSTGNGNCIAVTSSLVISIIKVASVSVIPSQSICSTASTINLSGNINGGTNTGIWNTNGSGIFNPSPTTLNNTYFINPADVIAGLITFSLSSTNNGPCPAVTNTLTLSFFTLALVNAGPNQLICSSDGTIGLNATSTNMGAWTTNGTGIFIPNNSALNATYSISPTDIVVGSVTFTFSSANNGACPLVQDSVKMGIKTIAVVNSGPNQSICSSTGTIGLTGAIGGGSSGGIWTTNGLGTFNPGPTSLSNTYLINVADVTAGSVTFTLTSSNNGPCPVVFDTVVISLFKLATVNSGPNQALCANVNTLSLNGSVISSSNTGVWTSNGTGIFMPDNININPTYSISTADINAGSVIFTLSSTNNGPCPVIKDTVKITIKKLAVVNAGPDKIICSTSTMVSITGTISGGTTSGIWTNNGSGSVTPNNTIMSISYITTPQDINSGTITLVLTSSNNGVCPVITDTAKILIKKNPVIKLTGDTAVCSYQNPLVLHPNVSGDFGLLKWASAGLGGFVPTDIGNPISYNLSNDIPVGNVLLSISAINNGPCANATSYINVVIHPTPTANYSPSTFTASVPNDNITFTNLSTNANTYYWSFGDGITTNAVSPIHNYRDVGYFNVELIAYNKYGCSDTIAKKILVISDIVFPNVFTPNPNGPNGGIYDVNDYSNDVFFPYTAGVVEYDLKIFNRWGELIFQSFDLKIGWDGYFKNKLCQQDGYVWKADVKFFDGRKYNKTGSVTLLR